MMPINDLGHDGEPQPDTSLLRSHKWIEDLLTQLRRNARPGVCDANLDALCAAAMRDIAPRPSRSHAQTASSVSPHCIISILHDVDERLLDQALIDRHRRKVGLILLFHSNG